VAAVRLTRDCTHSLRHSTLHTSSSSPTAAVVAVTTARNIASIVRKSARQLDALGPGCCYSYCTDKIVHRHHLTNYTASVVEQHWL